MNAIYPLGMLTAMMLTVAAPAIYFAGKERRGRASSSEQPRPEPAPPRMIQTEVVTSERRESVEADGTTVTRFNSTTVVEIKVE